MTPHQRLGFLASQLRQPLPTNVKFDMTVWQKPHSCGTAACAAGYAAMLPALQADGLKCTPGNAVGIIEFEDHLGFCALARFFDLSERNTRWVFGDESYDIDHARSITPAMVADRIDQVVADLGDGETAPPS